VREKIIEYIIESPRITQAIRNICPGILHDDFQSHFYLQILTMKPEKLIKAYESGYLDFLCIRIMTNQFNSKSSSFFKIYKGSQAIEIIDWDTALRYNNIPDDEYIETKEYKLEDVIKDVLPKHKHIGTGDWYDYELYNLYFYKNLTYQKIEKMTGINFRSVSLSVRKTVKKIKEYINDNPDKHTY
jgi:hypothetical protein